MIFHEALVDIPKDLRCRNVMHHAEPHGGVVEGDRIDCCDPNSGTLALALALALQLQGTQALQSVEPAVDRHVSVRMLGGRFLECGHPL